MDSEAKMAIVVVSSLGAYAICLVTSKKYLEDTAMMFRLEKTTFKVAIENPIQTALIVLSFVLPILLIPSN